MKKFLFLLAAFGLVFPVVSAEEDEFQGIEEVIVTAEKRTASIPVSYTHLTLPTIYSV